MQYGNGLPGLTADRYMNFSSAPALDKKIYDLTAENIRTLSKLSASTGIDCELETNGVLQVSRQTGNHSILLDQRVHQD